MERPSRDGTHHERRLRGELLKPRPQPLDPVDRNQAAQRLDREVGVAVGGDGLTQRRGGIAAAQGPEDPRRDDRAVAVGMAQRPHQLLVVGESGWARYRPAAADAGSGRMGIEAVAVKAPVHRSILARER
jgi:hypothetical protein